MPSVEAVSGDAPAGVGQSKPPSSVSPSSSSPSAHPLLPPQPASGTALEGLGDSEGLVGQWYDFNDSWIKPVGLDSLERQFEGGESAYMLFYRRRADAVPEGQEAAGGMELKRGGAAEGLPRVPEHLIGEVENYSKKVGVRVL